MTGCLPFSGPAGSVFLLTTPREHPVPVGTSHIPPRTSAPAGPQLDQEDVVIRALLPPLPLLSLPLPPCQHEPNRAASLPLSPPPPLLSISLHPTHTTLPNTLAGLLSASHADPCWAKVERALKSSAATACRSWQRVSERLPERRGSREAGPPEIPQLTDATVVSLCFVASGNRPPSLNVYKALHSVEPVYSHHEGVIVTDIIRK